MAKVLFSPAISNATGSAGTDTFMGSRVGPILRGPITIGLAKTIGRSLSQNSLQNAARSYANLSSTDKAAWATAASSILVLNPVTGQHYPMSGISYFCQLATFYRLLNPGQQAPTTPPTGSFTGDTITISVLAGTGSIQWTGSAQQAAGVETIFLTQLLPNAGRKPGLGAYRKSKHTAIPATPFQVVQSIGRGFYAVGYQFGEKTTGRTVPPVFLGTIQVT